jgi:hypothetical protein
MDMSAVAVRNRFRVGLSMHPCSGRQAVLHPADRHHRHRPGRRTRPHPRVLEPVTGQIHAEHALVAPGEVSNVADHYDRPHPDAPRREARAKTPVEREFLSVGSVPSSPWSARRPRGSPGRLVRWSKSSPWVPRTHGRVARRTGAGGGVRAVAGRRRPVDPGHRRHAPRTTAAGQGLVLTLPSVPARSLDAYRSAYGTPGSGSLCVKRRPVTGSYERLRPWSHLYARADSRLFRGQAVGPVC